MFELKEALIDVFQLPWVYFQTRRFETNEEAFIKSSYYKDSSFKRLDEYFLKVHADINPYKISKIFLKGREEKNLHQYGETPLRVYEEMANRWHLKEKERFVEFGCGRVRGGLFLQHFYRCHYVGVDWIEEFIQKARMVQRELCLKNVSFLCQDMLSFNFSKKPDWIYIHGATWEDSFIKNLIGRLKDLPSEVKIVTVSFPLADYDLDFTTTDVMEAEFPFGKTLVFLNQLSK